MCLAMLPALLFAGGCSGIHTTQSVSPASFFLPGILKVTPPAGSPEDITPAFTPVNQLAQTN